MSLEQDMSNERWRVGDITLSTIVKIHASLSSGLDCIRKPGQHKCVINSITTTHLLHKGSRPAIRIVAGDLKKEARTYIKIIYLRCCRYGCIFLLKSQGVLELSDSDGGNFFFHLPTSVKHLALTNQTIAYGQTFG